MWNTDFSQSPRGKLVWLVDANGKVVMGERIQATRWCDIEQNKMFNPVAGMEIEKPLPPAGG